MPALAKAAIEALHILDCFHIVANMNKALDNVRAEETSRMRREGRAPILRKSRSRRRFIPTCTRGIIPSFAA
jgi:transposase